MIYYQKGNLLDAPEKIIVHGCNAQGVMGSGVAKAIRAKWPIAYHVYRKAYEEGEMCLGDIIPVHVDNKIIVNAITQKFYGKDEKRYVDYNALASCFLKIDQLTSAEHETRIAMPRIGAGLGGGKWDIISWLIGKNLFNLDVIIYEL